MWLIFETCVSLPLSLLKWYTGLRDQLRKGSEIMTVKEYEETQKEVIEIAMLLTELKKKDPQISERLKWMIEGIKLATCSKKEN